MARALDISQTLGALQFSGQVNAQNRARREQRRAQLLSTIGTVGGAAAGAALAPVGGGVAGARIGAGLGGAAAGVLSGGRIDTSGAVQAGLAGLGALQKQQEGQKIVGALNQKNTAAVQANQDIITQANAAINQNVLSLSEDLEEQTPQQEAAQQNALGVLNQRGAQLEQRGALFEAALQSGDPVGSLQRGLQLQKLQAGLDAPTPLSDRQKLEIQNLNRRGQIELTAGLRPTAAPRIPANAAQDSSGALVRTSTDVNKVRRFTEGVDKGKQVFAGVTPQEKGVTAKETRELAREERAAAKEARQVSGFKLKQENTLRDDFDRVSRNFRSIEESFTSISNLKLGADPAAGGISDQGLMIELTKMFDPGGRVAQGEVATLENTNSLPGSVRVFWGKLIAGDRLTDANRKEIVRLSERKFLGELVNQRQRIENFTANANANNLRVSAVTGGETPLAKRLLRTRFPNTVEEGKKNLDNGDFYFDKFSGKIRIWAGG